MSITVHLIHVLCLIAKCKGNKQGRVIDVVCVCV